MHDFFLLFNLIGSIQKIFFLEQRNFDRDSELFTYNVPPISADLMTGIHELKVIFTPLTGALSGEHNPEVMCKRCNGKSNL